jgi:WhiB family redox-sensing transcriptional regulator
MFPDEEWRQKAACKNTDPTVFFPFKHTVRTTSEALSYCAQCEVKAECLHIAVTYNYDGIWGGSTNDQRLHLLSVNNISRSRFTLDKAKTLLRQLPNVPVNIRSRKLNNKDLRS